MAQIVPPEPRKYRVRTRPKALIFTGFAIGWVPFSLILLTFDLTNQFGWWPVARVAVLILQGVFVVASALLWKFERPREIEVLGSDPEPPVMYMEK